jgi:hypothetical protein
MLTWECDNTADLRLRDGMDELVQEPSTGRSRMKIGDRTDKEKNL